jgi:hypothetical protein
VAARVTSWGHWTAGWWLILDALACYRLTRLAVRDTITQPVRRRLTDRYEGGWLLELASCPWCISVWIGCGVALATYFAPAIWSWPAAFLALSAVAGILSDREM